MLCRSRTDRRITAMLQGLGGVAELGGVSVLDVALASGSELELVLAFRRCTTPTRSSYMKDNPRRR